MCTFEICTLSLHDALPILVVEPHLVRPVPVVGRERSCEALTVQGDDSSPVIALDGLNHPLHIPRDRKSTRLNSSHVKISYAVFCLKKKIKKLSDDYTLFYF